MPGVVFIFSSTLTACFALKELQDLKIFQEGGVCFLILTISCHKSLCTSCFGTLRSLVRMCYRWHPHDRCFTFCSHWFSGLFRPMFLKVKSQLPWATSKKSSYTSECILGYFPMFIHSKKETDSSTLRSLIALCDTDIFALWVTLVPWLTWCSAMLPFKRETFSQNMPVINGAFLSHGGTPNSPWKPREPSSWGRALPWQSSPRGPARLARRPSRWASVGHGSRGFLE